MKRRSKGSSDSSNSGRESGECTPSPSQECGTVDDSSDVICVKEVVRKKASSTEQTQRQYRDFSSRSFAVYETNGGLLNTSSDSVEMINHDGDEIFVLDTTGVAKEFDESLEMVETSFGNVELPATHSKNVSRSEELNMSMVLTFAGTPESNSQPKQDRGRRTTTCFNCGGDHTLDKCDIPHDAKRIAKNKSAHFNNKRQSTARYTCHTEITGFKPGEISSDLRDALGIGANDIPEWIYRMRKMGFIDGYPPAYLKQAVEGASNVLLEFHMEGTFESTPSSIRKAKPRMNRDKLFYYPGFNIYRPKLNDREKRSFRVPSFAAFVSYHECALEDRLKEDSGVKQKSPSKRQSQGNVDVKNKKSKNVEQSLNDSIVEMMDDDVVSLNSSTSAAYLPSPKLRKVQESGAKNSCFETPVTSHLAVPRVHSSPALLGTSSSRCSGTPHGSAANTPSSKPELEKFREGIVPFEAREDVNLQRGFFGKLMKLIKNNGTEN